RRSRKGERKEPRPASRSHSVAARGRFWVGSAIYQLPYLLRKTRRHIGSLRSDPAVERMNRTISQSHRPSFFDTSNCVRDPVVEPSAKDSNRSRVTWKG